MFTPDYVMTQMREILCSLKLILVRAHSQLDKLKILYQGFVETFAFSQ